MDMTLAVQIKELQVSYDRQVVLPQVNVSIPTGQIVGILGPSGSGKTTLVKAIMGLIAGQTGTVTLFGNPVPSFAAIATTGYMSQNDALYEDLTALEHLLFFGRIQGLSSVAAKTRAKELLTFIGLTDDIKKPVRAFSGGMKRRLSLAIALIAKPPLLILDEPTVGIDPVLRKKFWDEFQALKAGGCTILATTHVMDEAVRCDRLLLIREGEIIADGSMTELMKATGEDTMEGAFLRYSTKSQKEVV